MDKIRTLQERIEELANDIQEMDINTKKYRDTIKKMNDLQSEIDEFYIERYIDLYEREF